MQEDSSEATFAGNGEEHQIVPRRVQPPWPPPGLVVAGAGAVTAAAFSDMCLSRNPAILLTDRG